jgi:alkanesulfonate monooxygenase SsuD/methylene tetrahydromethanopterin reductase-like flavin-dependent oxidoreductase (luciferase family)
MEFGILFTSHPNHATEPYPHRDVHARVTAEIQAADILSGGRVVLGLGSGYRPYEFEGFGCDFESRRDVQEEAMSTLPSFETPGRQIAFYHRHCAEAPAHLARNPAHGKVDVARWVYVAETDAEARRDSEEATRRPCAACGSSRST